MSTAISLQGDVEWESTPSTMEVGQWLKVDGTNEGPLDG